MKKTISDINEELLNKKVNGGYNKFLKRICDFTLAFAFIIILMPFYILLILTQIITSGFPIFYRPLRGGYKNKSFRIIKFRTMVKNADEIGGGTTALNDKRITKFGHLLRKTKLDETPQLFNILTGKMSFIGPRPELLKYTDGYENLEHYILKVRPGITDYSSIEFINLDEVVGNMNADQNYEEKVLRVKNKLRIKYVSEISLFTDVKIFFVTVIKVFKKTLSDIGGKHGKNKN